MKTRRPAGQDSTKHASEKKRKEYGSKEQKKIIIKASSAITCVIGHQKGQNRKSTLCDIPNNSEQGKARRRTERHNKMMRQGPRTAGPKKEPTKKGTKRGKTDQNRIGQNKKRPDG